MGDANFLGIFEDIGALFSGEQNLLIVLLFFTAVIIIYAVFVFYFYRFLAKKNIIKLNLHQYNKIQHPGAAKFFGVLLYIVEYIIVIPVVTIFWFVVLSMFLIVLSKSLDVAAIALIAASLIAAVRVASYINEGLSRDLAKMLPLTLLALAIIDPSFFSIQVFTQRFASIPSIFSHLPYYLLFIVGLEFLMRIIYTIGRIIRPEKTSIEEEVEGEEKNGGDE